MGGQPLTREDAYSFACVKAWELPAHVRGATALWASVGRTVLESLDMVRTCLHAMRCLDCVLTCSTDVDGLCSVRASTQLGTSTCGPAMCRSSCYLCQLSCCDRRSYPSWRLVAHGTLWDHASIIGPHLGPRQWASGFLSLLRNISAQSAARQMWSVSRTGGRVVDMLYIFAQVLYSVASQGSKRGQIWSRVCRAECLTSGWTWWRQLPRRVWPGCRTRTT